MAYKIVRSSGLGRDLDLIFAHLLQSHMALGDPVETAFERCLHRIETIKADLNALALAPHQGTLHLDIRPGLRHVTKNRAIFYFEIDELHRIVRILAVFFGGQDHQRLMLTRLGGIDET